jgi:stage II sporulation protein D
MKQKFFYVLICLTSFVFIAGSFSKNPIPEELFRVAKEHQEDGRYFEALSFYRDLLMNKWPQRLSVILFKNVGDIYYEFLEDDTKALACYEQLLEKFPQKSFMPTIHHRVAKISFRQGKRQKAIFHYKYIFASFPDYYRDNQLHAEIEKQERGEELLEEILLSIERSFPQYIRVLLQEACEQVQLSSEEGLEIFGLKSFARFKISPNEKIQCEIRNDKIYIRNVGLFKSPLGIKPIDKGCISFNGKSYRGHLRIYVKEEKLFIVNLAELEEYLYGVLPHEVPSSWPLSALKAQAIAARTYALYHMAKREHELFDVFSTTASQVYGGKDRERTSTRRAVDETRGLVLCNDNKIILALYHANSGGETEPSETVWGRRYVYLNGQKDEFSKYLPGASWDKLLSGDEISRRLMHFGFSEQIIEEIVPVERSNSGRITKLKIVLGDETLLLSGNSFRLMINPGKVKSANFSIEKKGRKFLFKGTGYGHGVGMSQWGAYQMAKKGYDYDRILKFYYPEVQIVPIGS